MTLDFGEHGRLGYIRDIVTKFLDDQMFVYPEYQAQIAGIRGSVVGMCVNCSLDAVGEIDGHLFCDGSMIESRLTVNISGLKPTELQVSQRFQRAIRTT